MSFAVLFLLVFAAFYFHFSITNVAVLFGGYFGFTELDKWYRRRERSKIVEQELRGWKADREDSECETKGNLSRRKLTGENQVIAARVVEAVERLL